MPNITPGATVPRLAQHPFFSCNSEQERLFSVCEGVSILDALNQVSCFLASAQSAAESADGGDVRLIWAAAYLIEMSKAVVDSAINGLAKEMAK